MDGSGRSRNGDETIASTDPYSFLNDPELLNSISEALSGGGLPPQTTFSSAWSNANISSDNLGAPSHPPTQFDLCGTAFDDAGFNSVDAMCALLQSYSQPLAFPDSIPGSVETMLSSSVGWNQPSSPPFSSDSLTSLWHSMSGSSASVAFTPSAENDESRAELPSLSPSASSNIQEQVGPGAERRQDSSLKTAAHPGATVNEHSQKVPIPRLQPLPSAVASKSTTSSARVEASPSTSAISTNSRTKLSHCAVERRYRTNMRQHLKNLRGIVPALRVLELKPGNRVSNLSLKPGTRRAGIDADADVEGEDVIDERGFIDGVKVSRNGSKTTAILKTIEYIRVLKRREMRLKHEQTGLKDLILSFPEGPERLRQWELDWREKFGGPEKDEEEEITDTIVDGPSDVDVDSTDNAESYPNLSERENAKRPRTGLSSSSSDEGKKGVIPSSGQTKNDDRASAPRRYIAIRPAPSFGAPEASLAAAPQTAKRKRGCPRKNPLPCPVTPPNAPAQRVSTVQPEVQQIPVTAQSQQSSDELAPLSTHSDSAGLQNEPQSGQYLFAIFTFVSFFTSPLPLSPDLFGVARDTPRTRIPFGSVLTDGHVRNDLERRGIHAGVSVPLDWHEVIHLIHLAFSVYFVFSIMRSGFPRLLHLSSKVLTTRLSRLGSSPISFPASLPQPCFTLEVRRDPGERFRKGAQKLKELSNGKLVMPAVETQVFREGLGLRPGLFGFLRTLLCLLWPSEKHEHWRLERRIFMRLVELVALDANSCVCSRLQMFLSTFRYGHGCTMTATELSSIALLIYPALRTKAARLWDVAVARVHGRAASSPYIYKPYETFILETLSVDEAAQAISRLHRNAGARVMTIVPDNGLCRGEYGAHRELASPLAALTRQMVHEYIRAEAENAFIQIASGEEGSSASSESGTIFDYDRLLVAGRALDPPTVALLNYLDYVLHSRPTDRTRHPDQDIAEENVKGWGDFERTHGELKALLDGIVLCRGLRVDTDEKGRSLEEAISASHRCPAGSFELKESLSSTAFDRTDALRRARNCVLDFLSTN